MKTAKELQLQLEAWAVEVRENQFKSTENPTQWNKLLNVCNQSVDVLKRQRMQDEATLAAAAEKARAKEAAKNNPQPEVIAEPVGEVQPEEEAPRTLLATNAPEGKRSYKRKDKDATPND